MDLPALEIEDLRFRYSGGGSPWIVDVGTLALNRGEQMLLTGTSGRGKSTLLHLIAGLMEPSSGRIRVAGQDVHALVGAKRDLFRGRHIGMIFQNFNLLHGFSALENVMAAMMFSEIPRNEHRDRGLDLLRYLGIDQPSRLPEQLSIGQQQRVAVARAMACDPVLVLADEPTASLDPDNAGIAVDLIENICRDKNAALLCVSHDPSLKDRFAQQRSLDELITQSETHQQVGERQSNSATALSDGGAHSERRIKRFQLPESIWEPLDLFMEAALLLVTYEDDPHEETRRRQRTAACAFGAADWLCQSREIAKDEMEWMQAGNAVMSKYIFVNGGQAFMERLGPEQIGRLLGEVSTGHGSLARCIQTGANSIRRWLSKSDETAPLNVTDCIMGREINAT